MSLLQEIQNGLTEAEAKRDFEEQQLIRELDELEKNPKPSLGIKETSDAAFYGMRDTAGQAGSRHDDYALLRAKSGQEAEDGTGGKPVMLKLGPNAQPRRIPNSMVKIVGGGPRGFSASVTDADGRSHMYKAVDVGDHWELTR